jgi:hypothetical protein
MLGISSIAPHLITAKYAPLKYKTVYSVMLVLVSNVLMDMLFQVVNVPHVLKYQVVINVLILLNV